VLLVAHALPLLPRGALPRATAWTIAGLCAALLLPKARGLRSSVFGPLLLGRRARLRHGVARRPEMVDLPPLRPTVPRPSAEAGRLAGADVLLFTIESMRADHGAATPTLDRLAASGIRSAHHVCVAPLTNEAHGALYSSAYAPGAPCPAFAALATAGYRRAYLTAVDTRLYGLRQILDRAGFDSIRDRLPDDYALLESDLGPRDRPRFLHVHTSHTHVPYQVVDRQRFARFDAADDLGRYRNSLEEADFLLGAFLERFRGTAEREPLIVVTADHGQSFGELGYRSHGSAVTAAQLMVPFVLHHSALAPRDVPWSTHFDVLPTILDLLGLPLEAPVFGESLLLPRREEDLRLLVRAPPPSRAETSNAGLLFGGRKIMVDWALDRGWEMGWDDEGARTLEESERACYFALLDRLLHEVGAP
jgi:hypothetical protein